MQLDWAGAGLGLGWGWAGAGAGWQTLWQLPEPLPWRWLQGVSLTLAAGDDVLRLLDARVVAEGLQKVAVDRHGRHRGAHPPARASTAAPRWEPARSSG